PNTNEGLYQCDTCTTPAARLWTMGNWSKFVRPGWVRIDTGSGNPQSGVYVTAFNNGTTQFAIVAVNNNSSTTSQTFNLANFPVGMNVVIPYVTSASGGLAVQSGVAITGGSFTYALPASSVVT